MRWTKPQIRALAEQVLREAGVNEPPVPIERLARERGAQVRYEPFDGELSGVLFRDADRAVIGINALHSRERQRFTIAHELGHLILDTADPVHVDRRFSIRMRDEVSAQAIDHTEIAANALAAELLVPARMLMRDLGGRTLDYEDDELITSLAHKYKVSIQAMIFRLANLGVIDLPTDTKAQ